MIELRRQFRQERLEYVDDIINNIEEDEYVYKTPVFGRVLMVAILSKIAGS